MHAELNTLSITHTNEQEAKASKDAADAAQDKLASAEALNATLSQEVCACPPCQIY